jgi:predicted dithiol-disulfide oxidoreductase (DUF899 family)
MTDHDSKIAVLEKEIFDKQVELNNLRRQCDPETVKDYELDGPNGKVRLSDLFGDRKDLLIVHNMGASCTYCTLWADGFNGMLSHFENRAAFVLVSPDAPDKQRQFADGRGWKFRMVSNGDSGFTEDMGFVREYQGKLSQWPGFSTFHRGDDGAIQRIAHASFGPGDPYCSIWHMAGVLKDGVGDWQPQYTYESPMDLHSRRDSSLTSPI